MPKSKSFYIIDGHAQIFRAYFAPFRDLRSPSGEPTKATFVFTQMLMNLIDQRKPDYLAMVIDSGDEFVFRKEIYPEYKSNREPPPEDFEPQEKRILQIVRDSGVPIFAKHGFEADDLIATMVKELCDLDYEVFLVSKDKDLRQLLTPCVHMYDVQADEVIDEARLFEKVGYRPQQAVEVQALMGDTVDNVPGVPGVGEKTAAKLINKYGSIESILKNVEELTPKMKENFRSFAEKLPISRQLVTLKDDVPMEFDPEACAFRGLNTRAMKPHLETLGFWALAKKIGDGEAPAPAKPQVEKKPARFEESLFGPGPSAEGPSVLNSDGCDYQLVNTEERFASFLSELKKQKRFAFDIETDALGAMCSNCIGMSFSWAHGTGFYLPVCGPPGCDVLVMDKVVRALRPILEDVKIKKVGHNLKYDLLVMRQCGVEVKGVSMDSMIAAFVLDAGRMQYGIDRLALDLLGFRKISTDELIGKGRKQVSMARVDLEKVARYACEDADIALRLCDLLEKKLDEMPALRKLCDDLETPLIDVLVEMEANGVAIDPQILKEQSDVLGERVEELRKQIFQAAGGEEFNIDSPRQLQEVLFDRLKLKIVKRTRTGPSTDVEVLEKLADKHAVPRLILEYRSLVKLKNTYLDNLTQFVDAKTGRIHGSFNQTGAATGRLSMSDPNLQNIPIRTDEGRRIRLAFVPGDPKNDVLVTADYSQIELRVLAHFTEEPALMKAFAADEDIHRAVAAEVFNVPRENVTREQRNYAKIVNFGIIYGVSPYGLARRIEGLTVDSARELIHAYNRRFPTIPRFLERCVMDAQTQGYVETILGRRRPIPDIRSAVLSIRNAAERVAINSVVQGSAADLIKTAMVNLHRRLKKEKRPSKMLLQVHDELVFETPEGAVEEDAQIIREEMQNAMLLKVPVKAEVGWGKNWQEGK
jgi:DNA polymerase-1